MRIEKSRTMCDEMSKVILIHYNKSEFYWVEAEEEARRKIILRIFLWCSVDIIQVHNVLYVCLPWVEHSLSLRPLYNRFVPNRSAIINTTIARKKIVHHR